MGRVPKALLERVEVDLQDVEDAAVQRRQRVFAFTVGGSDEWPYVEALLAGEDGVFVAASDYMKALPLSIARWLPSAYAVLGTDGYGLSESRAALRDHFEVSSTWIVFATLSTLAQANKRPVTNALDYAGEAGLDLNKATATA